MERPNLIIKPLPRCTISLHRVAIFLLMVLSPVALNSLSRIFCHEAPEMIHLLNGISYRGQRRWARQRRDCKMTEPTHSTHSDHRPGRGGAASHAWAIAPSGPSSSVLYRGTQPRGATDLVRPAFELELKEAFRSKANSPPTPPHLPPVRNINQLVPVAYLRLTCSIRSRITSLLTSLGTWKTRVWLQNTIQTLRFPSVFFTARVAII